MAEPNALHGQDVSELPDVRDALAAAAIMVGTLLAAMPGDRREWLEGCVARQGSMFPGAEKLQAASELILREMDEPRSVIGDA